MYFKNNALTPDDPIRMKQTLEVLAACFHRMCKRRCIFNSRDLSSSTLLVIVLVTYLDRIICQYK